MGLSLLFVGIGAYGQNKQVTLSASAMTVEQMLRSIEKQTSYLFVYNASEIDAKRKSRLKRHLFQTCYARFFVIQKLPGNKIKQISGCLLERL